MKYRSKIIYSLLLIFLFNIFIINVKANEIEFSNVEDGVLYLDLDSNKTKEIEVLNDEYDIYSCYQINGGGLTTSYNDGKCTITANNFDIGTVNIFLSKKGENINTNISKQITVNVDFDNYFNQVLKNFPNEINAKLYSNNYNKILDSYIPNGIGYSTENCKVEEEYQYCDLVLSYSYIKEQHENQPPVWEYITKSKKVRFLVFDTELPNIYSMLLDVGETREYTQGISIPNNINPDDLIFVSTNNTIVSINDGKITTKSPGVAEIRLYNKNTLEYTSGRIDVKEPKLKSIEEFVNYFDGKVVDIDAATTVWYGQNDQFYNSLAMQYFNTIYKSLSSKYHVGANRAICNGNKCTVEFSNYDNGNQETFTTKEFTINYKGIRSDDHLNLVVLPEQNMSYHNLNFDLYLDEDDTFDIIIDDEYLELDTYTFCFDTTGMSVECGNEQEDLSKRNTDYRLRGKKVGETKVQIISNKGYMKEIDVYITHHQNEMDGITEYFQTLESVNLPYQSIDFSNNLYYLEEIIKNKIENDVSFSSLSQYLNLDVECTFYDKCMVYSTLEKDVVNLDYPIHLQTLSNKLIYINYDTLNNNNVISNLISESKKINDRTLTLDNTLLLEKNYNDDEFYQNLIYKTDIPGIVNDSMFDIDFELLNTNELLDNIKGNGVYRISFKHDNEVIFKKDITIYSNHFMTMPPKEKNTIESRINYIKIYIDGLTKSDVVVEHVSDNVFKVIDENKTYHLILDQNKIVNIQHVSIMNTLVNLNIGDKYTIKYTKYPTFANTGEVTFESSNESVATVDENGVITAHGDGYAIIKASVNHSSSSMWVLVNRDMESILNEKLDSFDTNVTVLYGDIYNNDLENAIRNAIRNKNFNNDIMNFSLMVSKEDGKYYIYLEHYNYGERITSKKKEINYELKGIKINSKEIEINTGEKYDLGLYFTEGDINNLVIDYENKDIVKITNDGIITGLKPGYTYINISDKYNKYYNYTTVIVDKDKYYNNLIDNLKNQVIDINTSTYYDSELKLDEFDKIVSQIFRNRINELVPFYIFDKYIDSECNIEENKCVLKIKQYNNETYQEEIKEEYTLNIDIKGVFVDGDIKEIELEQEFEPLYKKYPENGEVLIESLDTDICVINNNKVKGINSGICPIKYSLNNYSSYQLVVVDKTAIIESIKNNFNSINNNLTLNLEHYVSPYGDTNEWNCEWDEYDSFYDVQIFFEAENRLDIPYEVYFNSDLKALETNPYQIDLKLNAYYYFSQENVYLYYNLLSDYTRTFNIDYAEINTEDRELGEEVKNNIKDNYNLNLLETLRFKMDGAPGMELYRYSSIENDIQEICPRCTYVFDNNRGGGGGGEDMMGMGGPIVIMKNGIPIASKVTNFEVRFGVEMDVVESVDDIIETIKEKVKEAYLEIKSLVPVTYSLRSRMFASPRNIPEPDVEVTRERDEETNDIYYNIKVEDISFRANVDVKTTNDAVYTRDVTEIKVNKDVVNLKLGESENITYEVLPSNATDKNVKWSSSNSSVAIYEDGKIVAKGVGNAVITVVAHNNVKKTISVNVTLPIIDDDTKVKKGDINLDGAINMTDLIKLRKQQAGLETLNKEASINADINNDGKVNMTDIIKLRKFFAGLEDIK